MGKIKQGWPISLLSLGLLAGPLPAYAVTFDAFAPLYGLDLQWWRIKNSGNWDAMFVTSLVGVDVFLGAKFLENFGINLGYQETDKRVKGVFVPAGSNATGNVVNNTGGGVTFKSRVRITGFYWDLVGYIPTDNGFEIFASIGSVWGRSTI